ncbi:MAG: exodeoxyribonuclease V subunit alpha [Ferrovum sp.]|nr:exodeoxyribonuclease V subunit alpha [Ferrovum sp.]NDU87764.1 exodeoxyribonuclease V subunit alpha [Ferrovum sp.]
MTPQHLLEILHYWSETGLIRALDYALARWIYTHDPKADWRVLLAAALLSHLESLGHTCLEVNQIAFNDPTESLQASTTPVSPPPPHLVPIWLNALKHCVLVGTPSTLTPPLVLQGSRLYLRRYWHFETMVAQELRLRTESTAPMTPDADLAHHWINQLFPATVRSPVTPDWQKVACVLALKGRFTVITGGPGTGKTHTAARLLTLLLALTPHARTMRIALAAPTGKAAARLNQAIFSALHELTPRLEKVLDLSPLIAHLSPACTLHSLLGARFGTRQWRHHGANPVALDLLIVDEASMIHLEMMATLLQAIPPHCRLILMGDKDQLSSVEAGAVLGDLCELAEQGNYRPETLSAIQHLSGVELPPEFMNPQGSNLSQHLVMLRHSHRFGSAIGQLACAVNAGDEATVLNCLHQGESTGVRWIPRGEPSLFAHLALDSKQTNYFAFFQCIQSRPKEPDQQESWIRKVITTFDRFRFLCAVHDGPWGVNTLNQMVEQQLTAFEWIKSQGEWYEGRPVLVTQNDHELGIFNGDIGITLRVVPEKSPLRVFFVTNEGIRSVSISRLNQVATAFAMTVHKSQGSEFEHTCLILPGNHTNVTRELIYTGITRARAALTLITDSPQTLTQGIARRVQRSSGLLDH